MWLQVIIIILRFTVYFFMLGVSSNYIADGHGSSISDNVFKGDGMSVLFGTTILSFMIHHSVPGKPKKMIFQYAWRHFMQG